MRKILFRAKAINREPNREYRTNYKNGDWVYGLASKLFRYKDSPPIAEMTNEDGVSGIDIDIDTLGQFTGKLDKNGKEIFEGDIVTQPVRETRKHSNCIIEFFDGKFQAHYKSKNNYFDRYYDINSYTKVIGNIYDNPEILEVK